MDLSFQDAMPTDENQQFLRMDDFQQFPGVPPYMGQPIHSVTPMPWESYGIMMNPFQTPMMSPSPMMNFRPPAYHQHEMDKKATSLDSSKGSQKGPDDIRSRLRDSLTEALKMVANEQSRDKLAAFLSGGKVVESSAVVCKMNYESEVSDPYGEDGPVEEAGPAPAKSRPKLPVFSPYKKMRVDSEETDFRWDQKVTEHAKLVSKNIELELLRVFRAVNRKYREKARSLLFNLKDKNNPELRARVFVGEISPQGLCSMTIEQLASKELSQWRMAKAEERAQMVVITDEDVNPSKLVKKTHKGEIIMEVDNDLPDVTGTSGKSGTESGNEEEQPTEVTEKEGAELEKQPEEPEELENQLQGNKQQGGELLDEAPASGGDVVSDSGAGTPSEPATGEHVGMENFEESTDVLLDVTDFKGLPEIMSMDGFLKALGCPVREDGSVEETKEGETTENEQTPSDEKKDDEESEVKADEIQSDSEPTKVEDTNTADPKAVEEPVSEQDNPLKRKLLDSEQRCDSPKIPQRESPRNEEVQTAKPQQQQQKQKPQQSLWDGSLQLTGARSTAVHAVFRSGHDVNLGVWPKLLEVKGRVKLGPLAKFLKDLCLSKSRAVTAVSFYSSDMATSSLSLLKEVVDQYEKSERVGYVEPGTGFELYLFPPGRTTWKFLTDNGRLKPSADIAPEKSEVLVGCIVWRRNPSESKGSSESKKSEKRSSSRSKQGSSSRPSSSSSALPPSIKPSQPSHHHPLQAKSQVSSESPTVSLQQQQHQHSSQSVVQHSVNEWHQSSPPPAAVLPPPGLPATEMLLPPGFCWQSKTTKNSMCDLDDLPEYDYEGHVPLAPPAPPTCSPMMVSMATMPMGGLSYASSSGPIYLQQQQQIQQQIQPVRPPQPPPVVASSRPAAPPPPLPPGPPPPTQSVGAYGQWVHPNQAAQQKSSSLHYKKASVNAAPPSSQRRYRS